jgi:pantoate--beta-alanine ligase
MDIFQDVAGLGETLTSYKRSGKRIGFVPTMGALHEGHLSLIYESRKRADITVCSIFVNPLQFNNSEDFEKYPIVLNHDISLLESASCDLLFQPSVKEMYPEKVDSFYDFGFIERVMEGAFRPGHFTGVGIVVKRLFDIVQPDLAFFGEKDFQQLLVIKKLVEIHQLNIEIVPCPIVRESDGLAMSSRNVRLSPAARALAPQINQVLKMSVAKRVEMDPETLIAWTMSALSSISGFQPEYFELSDAHTLQPIRVWKSGQEVIACAAVFLGEIRLIDNIRFIS